MSKPNDGGSFHPTLGEDGASLRAWLAGKALAGAIQMAIEYGKCGNGALKDVVVAEIAVGYADAVIAKLEKEKA